MAANSRFAVAVHVLLSMAYRDGESTTSAYLAKSVNTNPVVVRRILAALAKSGIIVARVGKSGGSKLAKSPEKINLYDVYRVMETDGPFALNANPENKACPVSRQVKKIMSGVFESAEKALENNLRATRLSDLLSRI